MLTNNFKKIIANILSSLGSTILGLTPVKDVSGAIVYLSGYINAWPRSVTTTFTTSATAAGIVVGSGTTAPTASDYRIETPITGITGVITGEKLLDENGNPTLIYNIIITNNKTESITITEIAYNQSVQCTTTEKSATGTNKVLCLDRTLLSTPLTIAANSQKVIQYTLKTNISGLLD